MNYEIHFYTLKLLRKKNRRAYYKNKTYGEILVKSNFKNIDY